MDSHRSGTQPDLEASAIHLLHRAGQCAGDLFSEEVVKSDLTPRQFAVLLTISRDEGLSQTEIVERTGIDRSTLADVIRRLQNKGYISRRRTRKDARAYAVKLTAKGSEALKATAPAAEQAEARLLSALDPAGREAFLANLGRIVASLECCGEKPTG